MRVLVVYASRYGATAGIAERIAGTLAAAGHEAVPRSVRSVEDLTGYEVFVIGSAIYFGRWLKQATMFVRRNGAFLVSRPVWLFSSGPLVPPESDATREEMLADAEPTEIAEFQESIHPRGHRVFFGALDPARLGLRDRLIRALPAGRQALPEGDFRVWAEVDAWTAEIARDLTVAE